MRFPNLIARPLLTAGAGLFSVVLIAAIYLGAAYGFGLPPFSPEPNLPSNIQFVLDRSFAMEEPFGDGTKMEAAVRAINQQILPNQVASSGNLAFRQFGGSCDGDNTQLLVGFGRGNLQKVEIALRDVDVGGETTFVNGIVQAIRSFDQAERPHAVRNEMVVIAGGEDTCQLRDSTALILQEIEQSEIQVEIRFILLDVPLDQQSEFNELALAISGELPLYASSPIELNERLTQVAAAMEGAAEGVRDGGTEPPDSTRSIAPSPTPTPISASTPARVNSNGQDSQQLLVVKRVTNDNGGTAREEDFSLRIDGNPVNAGVPTALDAGPHIVSEDRKAGYAVTIGGDCDAVGNVTLASGENLNCTVSNDDVAPVLTLDKIVINNDQGSQPEGAWTLTADGPTPLSGFGSPGSVDVVSGASFSAGTYSLSESGPGGYTPSAWECEGGGQSGNEITLGPGENATCTITNDDFASADLSLTGTVSDYTNAEGDQITYTLVVSNNGPGQATGIEITALLPEGLTVARADGPYDPATGVWSVVDLPAPLPSVTTATLNIQATVDPGADGRVITSSAEITAVDQTDPDSTPGNGDSLEDDRASVSITVGELIAFVSERDGNPELYVMGADGSDQTRLIVNSAAETLPDWSPNGHKIAYASNRDGDYEIFIMDLDGSNQTALTTNSANDVSPSWSPDGSMIAFTSYRDGNAEIYVMNGDGSHQTRLTDSVAADLNPTWSPDGSQIAFASSREGDLEVYVMDADGSLQTNLTNNTSADTLPDWSPNGGQIAFASNRDGNAEIYVMDADGSNVLRVTNISGDDYYPEWSGDGSMIAFRSERDGNLEIYTMGADGSGLTRLTTNPASDYYPVWSPGPGS